MGDVINIITTANVSSNLAKKRRRIYTTKNFFSKNKRIKKYCYYYYFIIEQNRICKCTGHIVSSAYLSQRLVLVVVEWSSQPYK